MKELVSMVVVVASTFAFYLTQTTDSRACVSGGTEVESTSSTDTHSFHPISRRMKLPGGIKLSTHHDLSS